MTTAANNPVPKAGASPSRRTVIFKWGGISVAVVLLLYFMPLVRVLPLASTQRDAPQTAFNAPQFVDGFWPGALMTAAENAVDVVDLRAALRADPAAAARRHGYRLGLSGIAAYLTRGEGRVVSATAEAVDIAVGDSDQVAVRIEIGPVFGNALRDGSGQLDVSRFSNTRDFNDISSEINRRVEEQILPQLQAGAVVGASVHFAGGVELSDSADPAAPLLLVPVVIEFQ